MENETLSNNDNAEKQEHELSPNMKALMGGEFGPAPKKVVVWGHGEWRKVDHIYTSDRYLFENSCHHTDVVKVEPGDAVFDLCSSSSWREELKKSGMDADGSVYTGQANQCFYFVQSEEKNE